MAIDVTKLFVTDKKNRCVRFMGNKCKCYIPMRYEPAGYLQIEDKIHTMGVFTMQINDSIWCGLQILTIVAIDPSKTYRETRNGEDFFICELAKGDMLLCDTHLIQEEMASYFIWKNYLSLGTRPEYLDYDNMATLFDNAKFFTSKDIGANHAIYEIIIAHLFRDPNDVAKLYRHSSMPPGKPPKQVSFRNISFVCTSVHSKLIGAYANDGLNGALMTENTDTNPGSLENLYRGAQ